MSTTATLPSEARPLLPGHWPEYLMEAAGLGAFMISAGAFGTLFEYAGSPVHALLPDPFIRRILMGLAMGLTAIGIIYSPWGKQSGAHINPAVTLTFLRLGKIAPRDAWFYVAAQFVGASAGIALVGLLIGRPLADPAVDFVVTKPGMAGIGPAFGGEVAISFALIMAVLLASNARKLNRYTGLIAGTLVALYISFEAPLSGMSMNPARSFGSALSARLWSALWLYFTAPPLGMLAAAELYLRLRGRAGVRCAKLHHENDKRCIFRCEYGR